MATSMIPTAEIRARAEAERMMDDLRKRTTAPAIQCSQGGVPYNDYHLKAKDAELSRLRARIVGMEKALERGRAHLYAVHNVGVDKGAFLKGAIGAALQAMDLEDSCPGHVASETDPKRCARCGIHIDSLRPDDTLKDPLPVRSGEEAMNARATRSA